MAGGEARDRAAGPRIDEVDGVRLQRERRLPGRRVCVPVVDREQTADCSSDGEQSRTRGKEEAPAPPPLRPECSASRCDQLMTRLVAVVRLLRERFPDHRREPRQSRRLLLEVGEHDGGVRAAHVRRPPGDAFVEQTAEGVEVGAAVELLAADLLGRRVVDGAERAGTAGRGRLLAEPPRQAEVREVAVAAPVDQHVGRLDVPVDEPPLVRRVERVGELLDDEERARRLEWPARELLLQIRAVHEPHRDVEPAGDLAGVVDRDDRRVVERGGEARLAQEALAEAHVPGELGREELERDGAVEREVARAIDDAHSTAAEQRLDPVTGQLLAHGEARLGPAAAHRPSGRVFSRHAPPWS